MRKSLMALAFAGACGNEGVSYEKSPNVPEEIADMVDEDIIDYSMDCDNGIINELVRAKIEKTLERTGCEPVVDLSCDMDRPSPGRADMDVRVKNCQ